MAEAVGITEKLREVSSAALRLSERLFALIGSERLLKEKHLAGLATELVEFALSLQNVVTVFDTLEIAYSARFIDSALHILAQAAAIVGAITARAETTAAPGSAWARQPVLRWNLRKAKCLEWKASLGASKLALLLMAEAIKVGTNTRNTRYCDSYYSLFLNLVTKRVQTSRRLQPA
jgi:hypothetical protein